MIDSHCHLDAEIFDDDRDAVLQRAWDAGLSHIVPIGMIPTSWPRVRALVEQYPQRMRAAAGVHPHDAAEWSPETEAVLREALAHPLVTALGEIGLDWFRDYAPAELQQRAFRRQLEIAAEVSRPFVLHCRDAHDDCVAAIRDVFGSAGATGPDGEPIGVAHCFSGNAAQAEAFVELGMWLSWAGNVTFAKAEALREAARRTDPATWLIETDAPYLAPVPRRGKRNEPAYVAHTAAALAELKGVEVAQIDRVTSANARRLFRLP